MQQLVYLYASVAIIYTADRDPSILQTCLIGCTNNFKRTIDAFSTLEHRHIRKAVQKNSPHSQIDNGRFTTLCKHRTSSWIWTWNANGIHTQESIRGNVTPRSTRLSVARVGRHWRLYPQCTTLRHLMATNANIGYRGLSCIIWHQGDRHLKTRVFQLGRVREDTKTWSGGIVFAGRNPDGRPSRSYSCVIYSAWGERSEALQIRARINKSARDLVCFASRSREFATFYYTK